MDGCPLGLRLVGEDKPTEFSYTFTANGTHFIAFWLSILHISSLKLQTLTAPLI